MAIDGAKLGEADRQFAVAARLGLVDLHVVRAVHGLEQVPLLLALPVPQGVDLLGGRPARGVLLEPNLKKRRELDELLFVGGGQPVGLQQADPAIDQRPAGVPEDGRELRVAVVGEVTAGLVHFDPPDMGRVDRGVAAGDQFVLDELFQGAADHRPLGEPEGQSLPDVVADVEQLVLLAQHPVVAAFRLFHLRQVGIEIFLAEERGAVQPLQRPARGVSLEVGPGDRQQLERLDSAGVGTVRPPAQVDKLSLPVEAERGVVGEAGLHVLHLEGLPQVVAQLHRFAAGKFEAVEDLAFGDNLGHFGFDAGEVVLPDRVGHVEVVIEPGGERRAKGEADPGEEPHDGAGHDVRRRVPHDRQRLGVAVGEQAEGNGLGGVGASGDRRFSQRAAGIDDPAIHHGTQAGFREAGPNALGHLQGGGGLGVFFAGSVGENNCEYGGGDPGERSRFLRDSGRDRLAGTKGETVGQRPWRSRQYR